MEEKKLTDYQVEIVKEIGNSLIEAISYKKPKIQLGDIVKNKSREETLDALRSLENDHGILDLDPTINFGFGKGGKGGYRVLDKAKELYGSYLKEKESAGSY